ncbi:MAG: sigma-70 family RNA polymerase sigma factor [Chloroflexaceae bacterium]|nr:sigma-70 family RNA polymerase sigma factor [Chloroflexaceae bacterium]
MAPSTPNPVPDFPEAGHPLVRSLEHLSDSELLALMQHHPDQGRYFTAIFCRYGGTLYHLVANLVAPSQIDGLFLWLWESIFAELPQLTLQPATESPLSSLQNWLIYTTALTASQKEITDSLLPANLAIASPPLRCYLQRGLNQLSPLLRLTVVMGDYFNWSDKRICAYLQSEGEVVTEAEIALYRHQGYEQLEATLPPDIQDIYW